MTTYFINAGNGIKRKDQSDYQLDWAVQRVTHKAVRANDAWPGTHTLLASLGYGVYKLIATSSTALGMIGAGAAVDLGYQISKMNAVRLPENEIVINVSLKKNGNIIYRSSNIYYVNDLDVNHYYQSKDRIGTDPTFNGKIFYTTD